MTLDNARETLPIIKALLFDRAEKLDNGFFPLTMCLKILTHNRLSSPGQHEHIIFVELAQ
jgi:hypothetical protein